MLLCATAFAASPLAGYSTVDSVIARLKELPLCPAEGIWQMAADGATFAIERADSDPAEPLPRNLRLTIIKSPLRRVRPGTLMGTARPTVKAGVYEASLSTRIADLGGLEIPRRFLLTVSPDGQTLTIEPFKSPLKFNLFRLLPYMYRGVVRLQQSRPDGLDGAVRLYPPSATNPLTPIYL